MCARVSGVDFGGYYCWAVHFTAVELLFGLGKDTYLSLSPENIEVNCYVKVQI